MIVRAAIIALCLQAAFSYAEDASKIRVVASFSVLGDLVSTLGGDHVALATLVGPNSDGHIYQPKPADAAAIAAAQVLVVNGLHFEGWMTRLIESVNYGGVVVTASDGVEPLLINGQPDPHAWQSLNHIRLYAHAITTALINQKPAAAPDLIRLNHRFIEAVTALQSEARSLFPRAPRGNPTVVTSHDAFAYLGHDLGLNFIAPLGMSTDKEASAQDVARLIRFIREHDITAVFVENIADARLLQQIANETDAVLGGRIYSDALSEVGGPADTYLKMVQHNLYMIGRALHQTPIHSGTK